MDHTTENPVMDRLFQIEVIGSPDDPMMVGRQGTEASGAQSGVRLQLIDQSRSCLPQISVV